MKSYIVTIALILAGCGSESTPDDSALGAEDNSSRRMNYLANAEFDETVNNWRPGWPTEWNSYYGAGAPGSAKVTASSTSSARGRAAFNQCVNLAESKRFDAGIRYSIGAESTQTGGGRLRVTWSDEKDCGGKKTTSQIHANIDGTAGSDWQQLELVNVEAPESAQSASITAIQSISGVGEFIVYWDDAYFAASE